MGKSLESIEIFWFARRAIDFCDRNFDGESTSYWLWALSFNSITYLSWAIESLQANIDIKARWIIKYFNVMLINILLIKNYGWKNVFTLRYSISIIPPATTLSPSYTTADCPGAMAETFS